MAFQTRKFFVLSALIMCLFNYSSLLSAETPVNGDFSTSSLYFSMDECSSYNTEGTNVDYSEFTAEVNNSSTCLQMNVLGGTVYREEPLRNPHSCTEGVDGSVGVCVSSVMDCTYPAGHMRSVKIDVEVTPGTEGSGSLSSISFYEQAPANYSWIDGDSGLNNYPTLYGIRVLKDGSEVFRSEGNNTTNDWTLESFSFLDNPAFTVTETSVFTFELIGYCLIGNGSLVTAWDLDEIRIESSCGTIIDGGSLALTNGSTSTTVCVGTSQAAMIDVAVSGNQGPSGAYIITDDAGNILALPPGNPPFDLSGAGTGVCLIWYASFNGPLTGLVVGNNASDIQGCFDLSNPVTVNRETANGGTISSPNGNEICAHGDNLIDVTLTGSTGTGRWVITDPNGNIIGLPNNPPFDLSQYSGDQNLIWHLGYNGNITGLQIGNNANNLGGCFNLSNSITISKMVADGGVLSSNGVTFINICDGNGTSNVVNIVANNTSGTNSQIVQTDGNGNITNTNPTFPLDLSGAASGTYLFYNVSWIGALNGLSNGSNVNNLDGFCFGLSNAVTVDKELANGGTISSPSGSDFEICIEGTVSDPIDISLTGAAGEFGRWVVTDPNGNIISLPNSPPFVLDPSLGETCMIWHLSFESSFRGLFIGQNVSEFEGCYDLSNSITVRKRSSSAGTISQAGQNFIDICGVNGSQVINIDIFNNFGANSQYILSDENGNIVALSPSPSFDFTSYSNGTYKITHVAYYAGVSGLFVGGNVDNITADCIDFSNEMTVNKYNPIAGTIGSATGGVINVCNDGIADMIDVTLTGNSGGFQRWLITDANGNIISLPGSSPFSFEGLPNGTCFLWSLSYENGIGGLSLGGNANTMTGCFALSNSIEVNKQEIGAGTLSSGGRTSVSVCLEDNLPNVIDVTNSGSNAPNGTYVVTDDQGNILDLAAGPSFDFSGAGPGVCRIYFVAYDQASGIAVGGNVNTITGCYAVSNFITVYRSQSAGGSITTTGGFTSASVCVGDGVADLVEANLFGSNSGGTDQWVITDGAGNILGLPASPPFDFDGAGTGICYIWNLNYAGNLTGLAMGANVSDLEGCYSLSNSIAVNRYDIDSSSSMSSLTYNMNACSALTGSTQFDYSDLTPVVSNDPSCTQLSGSSVYRNNPTEYPHSCTAGINGSTAVCVSSYDNCTFEANNPHAVRFDITVTPSGNGTGNLGSVSFYEAAPLNFTWVNGTSGPNNYPTLYGIRVMKNGTEIFRQTGLPTSNAYSLENFDFTANPEFTVSTATVFNFELLPYCLAGVQGTTVSAWDIDDLVVQTICEGGLNGGNLTLSGGTGATTIEVCADDGMDENITVDLLNSAGPNMAYVITDTDGTILGLPAGQPFNFEGAGEGTCLIWNLAFISGLQGATVGANAADLQGCYSLSNPITVVRKIGADCASPIVSGGNLNTSNGLTQEAFCINDGISDFVDVQIYNNVSESSAYVIVDATNTIVAMPAAFPYDFEGTGIGRAFIYHIAYNGDLANMAIGNTIDMIEGNYAFSNAVMIDRTSCSEVETVIPDDYVTDFSLYPNPAANIISIKNNKPSKYGSQVILYNSQGQIIGTYSITDQEIQVNISQYSEGLYYIKMISGNNEVSKGFSKL